MAHLFVLAAVMYVNDTDMLHWPPGVVHANVGQNVTPHKPSLGLFLYHFLHTMSL